MSAPKTHRFTCGASAGAGIEGNPVSIVCGYAEFVRVVDATGDILIEWPDGSKWLCGEGRRTAFKPGKGINSFLVRDFSGASNVVQLETCSDAETSDDRKELVGTAAVDQIALATFNTPTSGTVDTTGATILAANSGRRWVCVQADPANTDRLTVCAVGGAVGDGHILAPGQSTPVLPTSAAIRAIAATGSQGWRLSWGGP